VVLAQFIGSNTRGNIMNIPKYIKSLAASSCILLSITMD